MLAGSKREPLNALSGSVDASQTTLTLSGPLGPIADGDFLGIDGEIVAVVSRNDGTNQVTVLRGVNDTPAATHASGTRVEVNWRWFTADLLDYLGDEIRSWPDSIYAVAHADTTIGSSSRDVDLPLTRYRTPLRAVGRRGSKPWTDIPANEWRVDVGLPTTIHPSGNALTVGRGWLGATVRVSYAQGFDLSGLGTPATDITAIGLSEHQVDAAMYGVAWRALAAEEAMRSDMTDQPEPRIAEDVDAADAMRTASAYKAIRDLRLDEEKRRLRQLYQVRI